MNIDGKKTFCIAENRSEYDPHQDAAGVAHPTPHSLNPVRNCSQMESVKDSFHAAGDIGCDVDVPECSTL